MSSRAVHYRRRRFPTNGHLCFGRHRLSGILESIGRVASTIWNCQICLPVSAS